MSPALNPLKTHFTSPLRSHLRLSIRIRCNQGGTKQKPNPKKKIVLFGRVPTEDGRGATSSPSSSSPSVWRFVKRLPRKALALLSNLPLAIGEMAVIGSLMALGTINSINVEIIAPILGIICHLRVEII